MKAKLLLLTILAICLSGLGLRGEPWAVAIDGPGATLAQTNGTSSSPGSTTGNLLTNPGFEQDWVNTRAEGHVLSFRGDWFINQQDNMPDFWGLSGAWQYDRKVAHSGDASLELGVGGSASQSHPFAVAHTGGGPWGGYQVKNLTTNYPERFFRDVKASGWCKSEGVSEGGPIFLSLSVGDMSKKVEFSQGTHDWEYREIVLTKEELAAQYEGKPRPVTLPASISVQVSNGGQSGQVWFDDVVCEEILRHPVGLIKNPGFEEVDANGKPVGWSEQKKYRWIPPAYYVWTDWFHYFQDNRGLVEVDELIARSGKRSLKFLVYPGDEKYVESDPIILNHTEPRIVEVGVRVKADRIKYLDIRLVDQDGNDIPAAYFFGASYGGDGWSNVSGTYDWRYFFKMFQSEKPIKEARVWLCARGFNGNVLDDVGYRATCNQVGTLWWDDLKVTERDSSPEEVQARGVTVYADPQVEPWPLVVEELDLGERLWGENALRARVRNTTGQVQSVELQLVIGPGVKEVPSGGLSKLRAQIVVALKGEIGAGQAVDIRVAYPIRRLTRGWKEQEDVLPLISYGKEWRATRLAFNTWPVIADIELARIYSFPEENPMTVAINLGVGKGTLEQIDRLELEVKDKFSGQIRLKETISDLKAAMASVKIPEETMEFGGLQPLHWANSFNLISTQVDLSNVPARGANDPLRDHVLVVRAIGKDGGTIFEEQSEPFCRIERYQKQYEPIKEVKVREDGALVINGRPTFVTGGTHQSIRYGFDGPKFHEQGFLCVRWRQGFEDVVNLWKNFNTYTNECSPPASIDEVKQRRQLGLDGLICFNTGGWEADMLSRSEQQLQELKTLTREASQLTGRPSSWSPSGGHNPFDFELGNFFDVYTIEHEAWGPLGFQTELLPYVRGRPVAVMALPQLYDDTPLQKVRFELYENVIRGCRGWEMIQGLGDPTLFRGINAEIRHLEPAILSQEEGPKIVADPDISYMQRQVNGKTYVIATNSAPIIGGRWEWNELSKVGPNASHTGHSANQLRPTMWGLDVHSYREGKPIEIRPGDRIVQYVWVGRSEDPPEMVMLAIHGDGKWHHNAYWGDFDYDGFLKSGANLWLGGELYPVMWSFISPQRKPLADKLLFPRDSFVNLGTLPTSGQWVRLEMKAEDLGLVGKLVDGFGFITRNGNALWDNTALLREGKEISLCDGSVGIPKDELKEVKFLVPGARDGTKVKVLFEGRELVVRDGYFTDNFEGEDVYGDMWEGVLGDCIAWMGYDYRNAWFLVSGYNYNNGPVAVHVYEIQ